MGMGFAPTWLRQVSPPLLHMTTLTTAYTAFSFKLLYMSACRWEFFEAAWPHNNQHSAIKRSMQEMWSRSPNETPLQELWLPINTTLQ